MCSIKKNSKSKLVRVFLLSALAGFCLFFLVSCSTANSNAPIGTVESVLKSNNTSTPIAYSPWPDVLATAQNEASTLGKDYVVMHITELARGDKPICITLNGGSVVDIFTFVNPEGHRIQVAVNPADPPAILYTTPNYDDITPLISKEELARYSRALNYIKLSPMQACQKALPEVSLYSTDRGVMSVDMYMDYDANPKRTMGLPAVWEVSYDTLGNLDDNLHINLYLSPETGEIVRRDVYSGGGTPVPTRLPAR